MSTLQFPDNPGLNATYTGPNGVEYVWTGEYWAANDSNERFDARYVEVTGDNMTGALTLGGGVDDGGLTLNTDGVIRSHTLTTSEYSASADDQSGCQVGDNGTFSVQKPLGSTSRAIRVFNGKADPNDDTRLTAVINADGSARFDNNVQMASANTGQLAGFRNQLINGNFQIWQRGTTITSDGGQHYTVDMWKETGNNVGATVSRGDAPDGLAFSAVLDSATGSFQTGIELPEIGQPNNGQFALGSTWTLSVWCNKDLTSQTIPSLRWRAVVGAGN